MYFCGWPLLLPRHAEPYRWGLSIPPCCCRLRVTCGNTSPLTHSGLASRWLVGDDGWTESLTQQSRSEGWEWYIGASYLPNSGIFFCHFWHSLNNIHCECRKLARLKKKQKHSTGQREFSAQLSVSTSRHKQMASEKTSITKVSWSDRNDNSLLYQLLCHALRSNTEIFNAWPVGGQTDFP